MAHLLSLSGKVCVKCFKKGAERQLNQSSRIPNAVFILAIAPLTKFSL